MKWVCCRDYRKKAKTGRKVLMEQRRESQVTRGRRGKMGDAVGVVQGDGINQHRKRKVPSIAAQDARKIQ